MTDDIIEAWCERCGKLGPVDVTGLCTGCRSKEADKRRWREAIGWRANGLKGGLIYGAPFPEPDDEDAPLCTRCQELGKCGVISVDDEHLLSGCDLFRKRGEPSLGELRPEVKRFLEERDDENGEDNEL